MGIETCFLAALLSVIVLFLILVRNESSRLDRRLDDMTRMPVTSVRELRDGAVVKVLGTVAPTGEALVAPYSGRACCAYLARGMSLGMGCFDYPMDWSAVTEQERRCDLDLDDGTGRVAVRLDSGSMRFLPRRLAMVEARYPEAGTSLDEWRLELGATVAVVGVARVVYSLDAPRQVVIESPVLLER